MPLENPVPEELNLVLAANDATPPLGEWSANAEADVILARWKKSPPSPANNRRGQNLFGFYHPSNSSTHISGHISFRNDTAEAATAMLKWISHNRAWVSPDSRFNFPQTPESAPQVALLQFGDRIALTVKMQADAAHQLRIELFRNADCIREGGVWVFPLVRHVGEETPYHCNGFELPLDRLPVYPG